MVAIALALFGSCCTFLAVMSVIIFGISVSYILNLYFVYLTLGAAIVVATLGTKFVLCFFQNWTECLRPAGVTTVPRRPSSTTVYPFS
jgi:hypothetical protein